jgi:hypothetical protein
MHDMGKDRHIFFSEVIAMIEPKLCINHWKVLFKLCVFYVDRNPEAFKSLYRSPGYKKNQLVPCKNYVLQW